MELNRKQSLNATELKQENGRSDQILELSAFDLALVGGGNGHQLNEPPAASSTVLYNGRQV